MTEMLSGELGPAPQQDPIQSLSDRMRRGSPAPEQDPAEQRSRDLSRRLNEDAARTAAAKRQELGGVFNAAAQSNPEFAGRAIAVAKSLGITPEQFAEDNEARLRTAEKMVAEAELHRFHAGNPGLDNMLRHLPTVRILQDDLGNLQTISRAFDWWRRPYEAGAAINEAGVLKAKRMFGALTEDENRRLVELDGVMQLPGDEGFIGGAVGLVGQMAKPVLAAAGATIAGTAIGSPLAGVIAGASVMFGHTSVVEFGHEADAINNEVFEALLASGIGEAEARTQAHDAALWAGATYAVSSASLELLADFILAKPFYQAGKAVVGKVLRKGAGELTQITTGAALRRLFGATATGFVAETVTEGLQEGLASAAEVAAGKAVGVDTGPTAGGALSRALSVMGKMAQGMALIAPIGPLLHFAVDSGRVAQAKRNTELFTALDEQAKASKAKPRSEEVFGEVVEVLSGKGASEVFVEGSRLAQAILKSGQTREQFAQSLPDAAKQLAEIERSGIDGDVVIPMKDFAGKVAGGVLYQHVADSIRLSRNGYSNERAAEWLAEQDANRKAAASTVAARAAEISDWDQQLDVIEKRIHAEVTASPLAKTNPQLASTVARLYRMSVEVAAAQDDQKRTPAEFEAEHRLTFKMGEGAGLKQTVDLRSGLETLERFGIVKGQGPLRQGQFHTRSVAKALEERQRELHGEIDPEDRSEATRNKIAEWMAAEVQFERDADAAGGEGSGEGWYSVKFQRALDRVGDMFPELKSDTDARATLVALIAITSDGQEPFGNMEQAVDIYARFREGGENAGQFTLGRGHARQKSIVRNLAQLQKLYDERGVSGTHAYLLQEQTVKDLLKMRRAAGEKKVKSEFEVKTRVPMAATVFGAKLGSFYANLMGASGYLTMDRWWSRTFNRYRGRVVEKPTADGVATVRKMLVKRGVIPKDATDAEVIEATVPFRKSYEKKKFKKGTKLEIAANTVYKAAFEGLEDSPFGAKDRTFMIDTTKRAQELLREQGVEMSIADIQAALWYYEKRLYAEMGAKPSGTDSFLEASEDVVKRLHEAITTFNLSAATDKIPGLKKLFTEATAGDTTASELLNEILRSQIAYALSGIKGVAVTYTPVLGVYGGTAEPSLRVDITGPKSAMPAVAAALARVGQNLEQSEVHARQEPEKSTKPGHVYEDGSYNAPFLRIQLDRGYTQEEVDALAKQHKLFGLSLEGENHDVLERYYVGDPHDKAALRKFTTESRRLANALRAGDGRVRQGHARLWRYGDQGAIPYGSVADARVVPEGAEANAIAQRLASRYRGREVVAAQQAKKLTDEQRVLQERIAKAFDAMPVDNLANPVVARAYEALAAELREQYPTLPVRIEVWAGEGQPYRNSMEMRRDVLANNHLFIFATGKDSFGPPGADYSAHPLLASTEFTDVNGKPLLVNDLLRALHDYYAHTMTPAQFGPLGEEAAWRAHMSMTRSPLARWALTSETRGQNSWVNFGPKAEQNKGAKDATIFADQKTALLPMEFSLIGDPELDFEMAQLEQTVATLQQGTRGSFDPLTNTAFLHDGTHNETTFLHEMAHFWAVTLFRMASSPTASATVTQRAQTLLDWFKVKDLATWNAMTLAEQAKHHEAFTYQFELYLHEGKAPSSKREVIALFRTVVRWFRNAYRSVRDELNERYKEEFGVDLPALTPEVRSVFDRILAAEDAVNTVEAQRSMEAMFQTQPKGMSDVAWAEYQRDQRDAHDSALERLTAASLRVMKWLGGNGRGAVLKAIQKETRAAYAAIEEEERAVAQQEPVYVARRALTAGESLEPDGTVVPVQIPKLDSADARRLLLSEGIGGSLTTLLPGITAESGASADVLASMLRFESGAALVRALATEPTLDEAVQARTEQRMVAEHSDLTDPALIERRVEEALHNPARTRLVAAELRFLAQSVSPISVVLGAARAVAREMIGRTVVRSVKPHQHAQAEARARREADRARSQPGDRTVVTKGGSRVIKGGLEEAVVQKRRELLESQLEREALEARDEIDRLRLLVRQMFKPDEKLGKTRAIDYVAVARALAAGFGLQPRGRDAAPQIAQLQKFDPDLFDELKGVFERAEQWQQEAKAQGREVRTYQDLTVDEFRDLSDAITTLWNKARAVKTVEIEGQKREVDEIAAELSQQEALSPGPDPAPLGARTEKELQANAWSRLWRRAVRPENWAWRKDGAERAGAFTKYVWRPVRDAVNKFQTARNRYTKRIAAMVRELRPKLKLGTIDFKVGDKVVYTFGRGNGGFGQAELIGALLHTGNAGNLRRLMLGRQDAPWGSVDLETGELNTDAWDKFIAEMVRQGVITKDVMDFVQATWDLFEELLPGAQAANLALHGHRAREVEATPIVMPWGVYRGGYAPAVLDAVARSAPSKKSLAEIEKDSRNQHASTGRSSMMRRSETFAEPLLLSLDLIPAHVDDVLRFTFIQPAVRGVERVLQHPDVAPVLNAKQPEVWNSFILPWLQRTASQSATHASVDPLMGDFWRALRTNTGLATMFANLGNALQQSLGVIVAAVKVKPHFLFAGMWNLLSERGGALTEIAKLSPFMANRQKSQLTEARDTINSLMVERSKFARVRAWVTQHGYFLQTAMQNLTDAVVWQGAYEQALAGQDRAALPEDARADAVQQADAAVRITQGSFDPSDVANYEEGTAFYRVFTQFGGYFNALANLHADQFTRMSRAQGYAKAGIAFQTYLLGFLVPALLADAITRTMRGQWEDEDEDGDVDVFTLDYLFLGQLRTALAEIPIAGQAINAAVGWFDDKQWNDRMLSTPAIELLQRAGQGTVRAMLNTFDPEKDVDGRNVRDVMTALGLWFGVPLGAVGSRAGYALDVATDKVEPTSAADFARGLLTGAASRESIR